MADITSGRARRMLSVGRLTTEVGGSYLWHALKRPFQSASRTEQTLLEAHIRNAERVVARSKELRGAFMKLAQLLSMRSDLFPAEEHPRPDRAVRFWDLETGREVRCLPGLVGDVRCVALAADGGRALVAGQDRSVLLVDLASGREVCRLRGHEGEVAGAALSADGRHALSGGVDRTVRLWRLPE